LIYFNGQKRDESDISQLMTRLVDKIARDDQEPERADCGVSRENAAGSPGMEPHQPAWCVRFHLLVSAGWPPWSGEFSAARRGRGATDRAGTATNQGASSRAHPGRAANRRSTTGAEQSTGDGAGAGIMPAGGDAQQHGANDKILKELSFAHAFALICC
jgi:hypothetical protein